MYHILYVDEYDNLCAEVATRIFTGDAPDSEILSLKLEQEGVTDEKKKEILLQELRTTVKTLFNSGTSEKEIKPQTLYLSICKSDDDQKCEMHLALSSALIQIDDITVRNLVKVAFETGKLDLTPYGKCVYD